MVLSSHKCRDNAARRRILRDTATVLTSVFLALEVTFLLAGRRHVGVRYCWPLHATVCPCMRLMERALCGYVWRLHHLLTATIYAQGFHSQPVTIYNTRHGPSKCNLFVVLTLRCQSF